MRIARHAAHQRVRHIRNEADNVVADPVGLGPIDPVLRFDTQVEDRHTVDERGRKRADECAILHAIAGGDDPRSLRQGVLAEAAFEQKGVERLLYVGGGGGKFVEEEAEGFRPFGEKDTWRAEHGALADDAGNAADVLRCDLGSQQRAARQAHLGGGLIDHLGLADARWREEQKTLLVRHALNKLLRLIERDRFRQCAAAGRVIETAYRAS